MMRHGLFDPGDEQATVSNDINVIFSREKWSQSSSVEEHFEPGFYAYKGPDGSARPWTASSDDMIWKALDLPLRLATQVLKSEHPAWDELHNPCWRVPVPDEDDVRRPDAKQSHPAFKILQRNEATRNQLGPESQFLEQFWKNNEPLRYGFDFIKDHVKWRFMPGYDTERPEDLEPGDKMRVDKEYEYNSPSLYDGMTRWVEEADGQPAHLSVSLAADPVYILMDDQLTTKEKMVVSFTLACTILHELSVRFFPRKFPASFHADAM